MQTTVVNIKKEKCDVYIGRPGYFGNPFRIGEHGDREMVLIHYKQWFYNKLNDPKFRSRIEGLRGKRLGCWCKPELCHGDIIVEYLEGKKDERTRNTPSVDLETFFGNEESKSV